MSILPLPFQNMSSALTKMYVPTTDKKCIPDTISKLLLPVIIYTLFIVGLPQRRAAPPPAAAAEDMMIQKLDTNSSNHVEQLSLGATPYVRTSSCYYQALCTLFFDSLGLNCMYHYMPDYLLSNLKWSISFIVKLTT